MKGFYFAQRAELEATVALVLRKPDGRKCKLCGSALCCLGFEARLLVFGFGSIWAGVVVSAFGEHYKQSSRKQATNRHTDR